MVDSDIQYASTPIVRITAEQLEYLIGRLRQYAPITPDQRLWTPLDPQQNVPGAGNIVQILPSNPQRRCLFIGAVGGNIFLGFGSYPTATSRGIFLQAGVQPIPIRTQEVGACLALPVFAFGAVAASQACWQEFEGPTEIR